MNNLELGSLVEAFSLKGNSQWSSVETDVYRYPVWNSGTKVSTWHSESNSDEELIFFAGIGSGAGYFEWISGPIYGGPLSSFLRVLSPDVLPKFLFYWLKAQDVTTYRLGQSQPFFDWKRFSRKIVEIPTRETQHEIVEILDAHNELADLQAERVKLLKLEKDVLLEKIFAPGDGFKFSIGDRHFDTAEWMTRRVADFAPISMESGTLENEYRLNIISTETMLPNAGGLVPYTRQPWEGKVGICRPGDIVVSRIRPYFRKAHLAKTYHAVAGDTPVFRPILGIADSAFVFALLSSQMYADHLMATITGMAIPRAEKSSMDSYLTRLPSLEDQQLISAYFSEVNNRIDLEEERLQLLRTQSAVVLESIFS